MERHDTIYVLPGSLVQEEQTWEGGSWKVKRALGSSPSEIIWWFGLRFKKECDRLRIISRRQNKMLEVTYH